MPTDAQRRQQASAHHAEVQALNERIALLEQQLAEAREQMSRQSSNGLDAARYRHLRDSAGNEIMKLLMELCHADSWDEAVDFAMKEQK